MALTMRYAVLFCRVGSEKPETVEWFGETAAEAIAGVQEVLGIQFRAAKAQELEAVVDTRKFGFNKEECAYLCSLKRIDDQMEKGFLPKPREGMQPKYTKEQLFAMIAPSNSFRSGTNGS
jgi:hypothetical protein